MIIGSQGGVNEGQGLHHSGLKGLGIKSGGGTLGGAKLHYTIHGVSHGNIQFQIQSRDE